MRASTSLSVQDNVYLSVGEARCSRVVETWSLCKAKRLHLPSVRVLHADPLSDLRPPVPQYPSGKVHQTLLESGNLFVPWPTEAD